MLARDDQMPYISLDGNTNEVLLLHGTSEESARLIIRHGFDDRLTQRTHYGRGVYLTTDACKAYDLVIKTGQGVLTRGFSWQNRTGQGVGVLMSRCAAMEVAQCIIINARQVTTQRSSSLQGLEETSLRNHLGRMSRKTDVKWHCM